MKNYLEGPHGDVGCWVLSFVVDRVSSSAAALCLPNRQLSWKAKEGDT